MKQTKQFFVKNSRLNKGYLKHENPNVEDNKFYRKKFEYLLPPIEVMEEYENIHPGTLGKLIMMAQNEQIHRQKVEISNLEMHRNITKNAKLAAMFFILMICITTIVLSLIAEYFMALAFLCAWCICVLVGFFFSAPKFIRRKEFFQK